MGITGLLSYIKKACYTGHITSFKGKTVVVDASILLHRGVFGCAEKVVNGKHTEFYIYYIKKQLDMLLSLNCHIILVFDGQPLPAKKETQNARRALREKNQLLGMQLLKEGLRAEAEKAFQSGFAITRDIVMNTIKAFRGQKNIDIIVAPYESDAQISFIMQEGLADVAITEDSDLIVFGCEKIIFKLETTGRCQIFDKKLLSSCLCHALSKRFDFAIFRRICIMAGCDYLQGGIQGIGFKKAEEFFARTARTDLREILPRIPHYLNMQSLKIRKGFIEEFIKAENTFLYQVVFDPINREQKPLNPYPDGQEHQFDYAGMVVSPEKALRLSLGNDDLSVPSLQDPFVLPLAISTSSVWSVRHRKFIEDRKAKEQFEKYGAFKVQEDAVKRRRSDTVNVMSKDENSDDTICLSPSQKKNRGSLMNDHANTPIISSKGRWNAEDWLREYMPSNVPCEDSNITSSPQSSPDLVPLSSVHVNSLSLNGRSPLLERNNGPHESGGSQNQPLSQSPVKAKRRSIDELSESTAFKTASTFSRSAYKPLSFAKALSQSRIK